MLCVAILTSALFFLYKLNHEEESRVEELLTDADLEFLKQFENQTIKAGYAAGYERFFTETLSDVLEDALSVRVEFIQYDDYAELEEYVIQGEVDVLISLTNGERREELYYSSAMVASNRIVITDIQNPLYEMARIENSKVGFLRGSTFYSGTTEFVGSGNAETYFFDTVDEALDALEKQEIEVFITGESNKEKLVPRESLQIEFAFQDEFAHIQFATAKEEVHLLFEIIRTFFHSSSGETLNEELLLRNSQFIEEQMRAYIQEKYQDIIEQHEVIEVGMHSSNFPYSYFDTNGDPTGIYVEMLGLFYSITGIRYHIQNDAENTNFANLLDDLANNDIQFLLGVVDEKQREEILKVGMLEVQDNIISIMKVGDGNEMPKNLDDIHFGTVSTMKQSIAQILDTYEYTEFVNYESAIEALRNGEVDVLLGKESVLSYYQGVRSHFWLKQTALINKVSSHSILGHVDNEDLNSLMGEVQRFYNILHTEDQEMRWDNQAMGYQSKYVQLRDRQSNLELSIAILSLSLVVVIIGNTLLRKRRENIWLKRENELDKLTGLYNRYAYKKKCMKLIHKYPNKLGVFFFIDLNNFKEINDTYGHVVGDNILIHFGEVLRRLEDEHTVLFRIAGDEFGIFRMGFHSRDEIVQMIHEIKQAMQGEVFVDGNLSIPIEFSAGGSIYNLDTTEFEPKLIEYADIAMYQAKKKKGDSIAIELFDKDGIHSS